MEMMIMKSPYEVENKTIAIGFVIAFIILIIVALIFHKELISFLMNAISTIIYGQGRCFTLSNN